MSSADALRAAEKLAREGIHVGVVNIHTIKPIDAGLLQRGGGSAAGAFSRSRITAWSAASAARSSRRSRKFPTSSIRIHGVRGYGESGTHAELYARHGLDIGGIAAVAKDFICGEAGPRKPRA